ncbi:MAG: aminotransferase [Hyphomicrobiales bacterium]|nr:aminotransferase [Hyphomicrobiales bacterium]MCY4037943.1 aminotransferase [Hyphomicrobiales bacterium]
MNKTRSNTAVTLTEYDNRHYLHPWEAMESYGNANRLIATKAEGIYIYDQHGRKLIDGPGGMWCVQIGHGRKEIADAIVEQIDTLSYCSPWFMTSAPGATLAQTLAEMAPGDLNNVFFTTGGSTAVDTAIRAMHFYNNRLGRPNKKIMIAREKGYHGSTFLAASVSGKERDKSWFDIDSPLVRILPNVNPNLRPEGTSLEEWCDAKVKDLEDTILEAGAENVGGFIAEPVLASGGVIIPPPDYHRKTLEICRKYDVLYISDEVVCAFGRLGHWFSSQEVFGITPDIITCAKGLTSGYQPLGACIISDRIINAISGAGQEDVLFSNGYTYSGHPIPCAAALKNIEIMQRENILEHVREISPYFLERLEALKRYPVVGDARAIGLVGCIEGRIQSQNDSEPERLQLDRDIGYQIDQACEEKGLIVRPLINMCVFSPPLVITRNELSNMMDILESTVAELSEKSA